VKRPWIRGLILETMYGLEKSNCYVHIRFLSAFFFRVVHKEEVGKEASDPRPFICR
jgi:hypothetical protein